jgi:hypothetical protein
MAQSAENRHASEPDGPASEAPIPLGQRYFDRIFLLLGISILISALIYNAWGIIELLVLPTLP